MRKTNRLWAIFLALVFIFYINIGLTACSKSGTIPDGKYEQIDYFSQTYIYGKNLNSEAYWKIEKNRAEFWDSGGCGYQAQIVEKDGKIYFEGYKYLDLSNIIFLSDWERKWEKVGDNNVYLVEYNVAEKSITVELYKKGG